TLPAPTPIYGSLVVEGSPIMADVVLDGENIGQIPLKVDKILVGTHTLTISKSGYSTDTQIINVDEGRITEVVVKLNKNLISDLKGVTPIEIDSSLTAEQLNSKGVELDNNGDYNSAVQYFYEAAKREYAVAQYNLGNYYYVGKCVTKDYAEAAKWYLKAAELGHKFAQNNLGALYYNGQGVAQDYNEAAKWFLKAAEQGEASAQNNLGKCYEDGLGVTKNLSEARKWYRKAAEQGNVNAKKRLQALGWEKIIDKTKKIF
ncbi:MAG: SEL1-like repeat protein, partial [Alistipes sp.]|nr:SEL1-like repeat protein [Alistipes sp.]